LHIGVAAVIAVLAAVQVVLLRRPVPRVAVTGVQQLGLGAAVVVAAGILLSP
jgi:hypothetical protein